LPRNTFPRCYISFHLDLPHFPLISRLTLQERETSLVPPLKLISSSTLSHSSLQPRLPSLQPQFGPHFSLSRYLTSISTEDQLARTLDATSTLARRSFPPRLPRFTSLAHNWSIHLHLSTNFASPKELRFHLSMDLTSMVARRCFISIGNFDLSLLLLASQSPVTSTTPRTRH
jgi:hypothetical protein